MKTIFVPICIALLTLSHATAQPVRSPAPDTSTRERVMTPSFGTPLTGAPTPATGGKRP